MPHIVDEHLVQCKSFSSTDLVQILDRFINGSYDVPVAIKGVEDIRSGLPHDGYGRALANLVKAQLLQPFAHGPEAQQCLVETGLLRRENTGKILASLDIVDAIARDVLRNPQLTTEAKLIQIRQFQGLMYILLPIHCENDGKLSYGDQSTTTKQLFDATEIEEPFISKLWSLYCKTQNGEAIEMTGNTTREVLQRHARDIRREEAFAKRDERLARQEQEVARRELAITRRELDADQRERYLVERETALALRGAELVQRMGALKLLS